jgi:hypothetical protein
LAKTTVEAKPGGEPRSPGNGPWLAAALSLTVACAHVTAPREPLSAEGWEEATTLHFRVHAGDGRSRAHAQRLEAMRAALLRQLPAPSASALRVEVVVFPSREEMKWFVAPRQLGYTHCDESGLRIVMSAEAFADEESQFTAAVAHELTHYVSQYSIRHQPRWVGEGLANFLETVTFQPNGDIYIGRPLWHTLQYSRQLFQDPWARGGNTLPWLWQWSEMSYDDTRRLPAHQDAGSYALSWAWMHLLINQYRPRLEAFFAALNRAEPPREAFDRAFAGVALSDLEHRLPAYVAGEVPVWSLKGPDLTGLEATVRPMAAAEVHALRARLFVRDKPPVGDLEPFITYELQMALKLDPALNEARLMQLERLADPREQLEAVEALARTTDDSLVWTELAMLFASRPGGGDDPLRPVAFRRVAALPDDPRAQTIAAIGAAIEGDFPRAQQLIQRALDLAPWSTVAHVTAALIHKTTGDCAAAKDEERNVAALLRHASDAAVAAELKRKLEAVSCGERRGASPSRP